GRGRRAGPAGVRAAQQLVRRRSPHVEASRIILETVLCELGRFAEAEEFCQQSLASARRRFAGNTPEVASALAWLAWTLVEQRKFGEAEPIARECLVIRAEQMPGTWRHHVAMSLHGASLAGLRRFAEAEPLLRDGYDKMEPPPAGAIYKRLA